MQTDAVQLDLFSADPNNRPMLLSALGDGIQNDFQHSVVPYDKNLVNYKKETKELLKLCRKVCDRIAIEVI